MEFLLLGGMILLMSLLEKIEIFNEANKALMGLKLPIGIVVIFVGLSAFAKGASFIFPGIMGLVCGVFLIIDLIKLIPKATESAEKVNITLVGFQIPIGILTVLSAIIGLFLE